MTRLLELHSKRGWLREVVTESILTLLAAVSPKVVVDSGLIEKLSPMLAQPEPVPISEMTAWQLMLSMGLQHYARTLSSSHATEKKGKSTISDICNSIAEMLPVEGVVTVAAETTSQSGDPSGEGGMVTPETLSLMTATLLDATAGYPKIHRVWDFIVGGVFVMDADRQLPRKRYARTPHMHIYLHRTPVTVLPLSCHCSITVLPLSYDCPTTVLRLSCHCHVTALSLLYICCNYYYYCYYCYYPCCCPCYRHCYVTTAATMLPLSVCLHYPGRYASVVFCCVLLCAAVCCSVLVLCCGVTCCCTVPWHGMARYGMAWRAMRRSIGLSSISYRVSQ